MNEFFVLAAHNTLAALILALFVLATTAVWRNPPLAHVLCPLFHSFSLKARVEMILKGRFAPSVSARSLLVVALFLPLVVPSFLPLPEGAAQAGPEAQTPATDAGRADEKAVADQTETSNRSEFPYVLKFEQGATEFLKGDDIQILEVRGTDAEFTAGHIYWIRGTYKLGSRDRATLAAFTTATDGPGSGESLKVQTTVVNRGTGTFTLFLPMLYKGWPHVSFYPAEGGNGFGENYFGTGDSVKKPHRRPQEAKAELPEGVSYLWTDSRGVRYVERRVPDSDTGRLKLVEETRFIGDLPPGDEAPSERFDMPSPEAVLRALPKEQPTERPFVSTAGRRNVRIVVEKTVDKIGEERNYPLVGAARLHRRHYKCTVYFDKVVTSEWPIPFSHAEPAVEVVHIDHDSLIR